MSYLIIIFFVFLRIISNPIANLFQKRLSNEISSVIINFYTYLILSICCVPFLNKYIITYSYPLNLWCYVFIAGFLCALGTIFLIKAVNIGELSIIGPINAYKSVIGLLSAFILLKEIPSIFGIIGIFLIVLGSKYMFKIENNDVSVFKRKDIRYRFYALILTGIEATILKQIIILSSIEACFIFWCFSGLIWSTIFCMATKQTIAIKSNKCFFNLCSIAFCLGIMQYSTNFVFSKMNVGYALALFQLSSIVCVILGCKFFNEHEIKRKLIASFIMIIGSIMIILF